MRKFYILWGLFLFSMSVCAQTRKKIVFDYNSPEQTMHSFGASDCWRVQYIGKNWPLEKREKIADLLFSSKLDNSGNPQGIGLSLWRFNIGSGSHEAGDASGVESLWRRTECFMDKSGNWDWNKQEGQRWMLDAAKGRGVSYTLGFSITAPYFMTKNGMARASEKNKYANIRDDAYDDYAAFMAEVASKLNLDYLSPINEPQWEWVRSNQEGMQATNQECSKLIHLLDKELNIRKSHTQVIFGEAGDIRYLYRKDTDKPDRDNQLEEMFSTSGKYSISHLSSVAPIVTGHSYWSTWPLDTLVNTRIQLKREIENKVSENFEYWQTEYCPMEKNEDNPKGGGGRDLNMNTALYIARVIHHDLTVANASSWQWWTAFSEWDYKDGLIYIDDGNLQSGASKGNEPMIETCQKDGVFRTSKTLWALGNYSFFIRPGMVRVASSIANENRNLIEDASGLMASAFIDKQKKKVVIVLINYAKEEYVVDISLKSAPKELSFEQFKMYETSERSDLQYKGIFSNSVLIPAQSVITLETYN